MIDFTRLAFSRRNYFSGEGVAVYPIGTQPEKMEISCEDIGPNLRRIALSGRLDILGTDTIAPRFAAYATEGARNVVVDFTAVTFLASIGIRALISNAKALHKVGGRMAVVVGDNTPVARTLDATGIDVLLQIHTSMDEAARALTGMPA
jgi:anti-anti-sigma factor